MPPSSIPTRSSSALAATRASPRPPTASRRSPWAVDKQDRFGHNSIYGVGDANAKQKHAKAVPKRGVDRLYVRELTGDNVLANSNVKDSDEDFARELAEHIANGEAHLERMKAILQAHLIRIERPIAPPLPHEAIVTPGDVLQEVLLNVPVDSLIGVAPRVCSAWRVASANVSVFQLSPMLAPSAIRPLMTSMPTFRTLVRVSGVCKIWRAASRSECAEWRRAVELEIHERADEHERAALNFDLPWPPLEISHLPFVDKVLRIALRVGIEVVSSGGLVAVVRKAYKVLGLMPKLHLDDRAVLEHHWPELTMVARPDETPAGFDNDDDSLFVVAGLERIDPRVKALADALAVALLIVGSNLEEESEGRFVGDHPEEDEWVQTEGDDARTLLGVAAQALANGI